MISVVWLVFPDPASPGGGPRLLTGLLTGGEAGAGLGGALDGGLALVGGGHGLASSRIGAEEGHGSAWEPGFMEALGEAWGTLWAQLSLQMWIGGQEGKTLYTSIQYPTNCVN